MSKHSAAAWFTLGDFARYIGVSESTARRILRRGELTYINVGRRPRIRPEDVEDYIERQTREAVT